MTALYVIAGCMHFIKPNTYGKIMPPWLPWPLLLVYISGAFEIALGALLLPAATRVLAAWGIIFLLIAVFPANIQMMLIYYRNHLPHRWLTVARLPLQLLLIWWAWIFTKR